jgi:putative membrane protein
MWGFPWMILVVFAVIAFCVFFGRRGFHRHWGSCHRDDNRENRPTETPLDILKRRYAKGEITKEEFQQMKKDLEL